jgi:predicted PurR-regulated permease PerM
MASIVQRIDLYLGVILVIALAIGSLFVLSPFLPALLWAVILVVSTWPAYEWLQRRLGGRRSLAAAALTLFFAALFLVPLVIIGNQLAFRGPLVLNAVRQVLAETGGAAPRWIASIPLIGEALARQWQSLAADLPQLVEFLRPYVLKAAELLLGLGTWFGAAVFQIAISLLVAFFLYRGGVELLEHVERAAERVGGERGARMLRVSTLTMRSVVYGILGAASAQGVTASLGLWIAGVPGALLLGLMVGVVALVPIGLTMVTMLSACVWLFYTGATGWGIFLLVWTVLVTGQIDNVVQPFIISRGTRLPMIVTLLGVLGGVLMAGILGIFVGATLLGVSYNLICEWSDRPHEPARAPQPALPG